MIIFERRYTIPMDSVVVMKLASYIMWYEIRARNDRPLI